MALYATACRDFLMRQSDINELGNVFEGSAAQGRGGGCILVVFLIELNRHRTNPLKQSTTTRRVQKLNDFQMLRNLSSITHVREKVVKFYVSRWELPRRQALPNPHFAK